MVLYSFAENPSKIMPVASGNLSANLDLSLLVCKCSRKIQEYYQ